LSRNKDRLGGHQPEHSETPMQFNPLNFVAPTEFVELPSKGRGYPEHHPLSGNETIEIKFMTAKEEDILTSQALLKKGLAVDRFLQNVIMDKSINIDDLIIGDKNAILVAARGSGYGYDYETTITCPECGTKNDLTFDLRNPKVVGEFNPDQEIITQINNGTYSTKMPYSKFIIQFRLMAGSDEKALTQAMAKSSEESGSNLLTGQFKRLISSIEGHTEQPVIDQYVDNMPTIDSRHFKICLRSVTPNIEITETLNCKSCGFTKEVEVPFGADFFWPQF
jgi:transcription elongation factor Elf1